MQTGAARSLSGGLDLPAGVWAGSHLNHTEEVEGPLWLDDTSVVALLSIRGRSIPWRFPIAGDAKPEPLLAPTLRVVATGLQAAGGTITINAQLDRAASEISAVVNVGLQPVTRDGASWQRRFPKPRLEELELYGPAGPIRTWVYSPRAARRKRPATLIDIHGGPTGSWAPGASLDVIALTSAG